MRDDRGVARLILLNGPPGIGKSTHAQRYVDDHPLALNLDIDSVRRLLGRWQESPIEAGLLARAMTLTMAREHLRSGHDVVLPQYLGRPQFLREAEAVAAEAGAEFHELVLMTGRDDARDRFLRRTAAAELPVHVEAGRLVEGLGGVDVLGPMYDRLLLVIAQRPAAQVVSCPEGEIEAVYIELTSRLEALPAVDLDPDVATGTAE